MRKSVSKKLIVLFAALCALVTFACVSVSKFVLTDKKELIGVYTNFVLSHDGEGQTAVIRTNAENGETKYTGYIATTVSNFTEKEVSKRDVRFSLRAPTEAEVNSGYVTDAWSNQHKINAASKYYNVSIVDENDDIITDTSDVTLLKANARNSRSLLIKIERKASAGTVMPDEGTEQLSIILETSLPYKDLQVFTVNTTTARLSVGVSSDEYNGFETREIVNLKSAVDFIRNSTPSDSASYLAEVKFTLTGEVSFDAARYKETYGVEPEYDALNNIYIFTIRAGADVNLYFYATGSCSVTVSATIYDGSNSDEGSERISGVGDDKIVFQR